MAYTYLKLVHEVLQSAARPLTAAEIWSHAVQQGLNKKLKPGGLTPWATMGAQLYTETINNAEESKIIKLSGRPKRFFLRIRKHEIKDGIFDESNPDEKYVTEKTTYLEKDLHSLLAYFAYTNPIFFGERQVHTKTISHRRSTGKELKEWLHPDMVGVYFPFEDLKKNVINLSKSLNSSSVFQLFSFELKKNITPRNYRECFFQAVSNSSWAHEGYLVAAEISDDEELHRELARLTNAFGIGVIELKIDDIDSSRVLYGARNREALDWETINKLYTVNKDFASFIDRLNTDFGANQIHPSEYDEIIKNPVEYIQNTLKVKTAE